jgi:hypothetical protein
MSGRNQESDAPSDRFRDLVMKGGITSGVAYPPAISALAHKYCFKNIGGTSAGAIAAGVAATAEYRRRVTGTMHGFELLDGLPAELGKTDARGTTRLLRLFQADPCCRRLFRILNAGSTLRRVARTVSSSLLSIGLPRLPVSRPAFWCFSSRAYGWNSVSPSQDAGSRWISNLP